MVWYMFTLPYYEICYMLGLDGTQFKRLVGVFGTLRPNPQPLQFGAVPTQFLDVLNVDGLLVGPVLRRHSSAPLLGRLAVTHAETNERIVVLDILRDSNHAIALRKGDCGLAVLRQHKGGKESWDFFASRLGSDDLGKNGAVSVRCDEFVMLGRRCHAIIFLRGSLVLQDNRNRINSKNEDAIFGCNLLHSNNHESFVILKSIRNRKSSCGI